MLARPARGDNTQMTDWWPVAGLCVRTPRLELRLPGERDLDALATLAAADVHDPDVQPFTEVSTGSWLGRQHQGQGIGTEMRAAVLPLAFAGLGAEYAVSAAYSDNPASRGVSARLGYAADGIERRLSRGQPATLMRLRLDRATQAARERLRVMITALEPCLSMFDLSDSRPPGGTAGGGTAGATA